MSIEVVTKEDLQNLRVQLLDDLKILLSKLQEPPIESFQGYKTRHVKKILGCSTNKLQSLRISGKIRFKKVGGTIYYKGEDLRKLVDEDF